MGWSRILGALGRRWYLLLAGAVVTAGLGLAAWQLSPPLYTAHGTELLLPPEAQVAQGTHNPLLELTGLEAPAAFVIAQLNGQDSRERIEQLAPNAEYSVETDPALRGPTVMVTMTDETPEDTLRALTLVLDTVPEILQSSQSQLGVPAEAAVGTMRLAIDSEPSPELSPTLRTVILAIGVGIVITLALTVGVDALLRRRSARRRTQTEISTEASDDDEPEDTEILVTDQPAHAGGPPPVSARRSRTVRQSLPLDS